MMAIAVGDFSLRIQQTATISELEAIHSEITAARLPERNYTQLYYELVAQRLLIIRRVREKALEELKAPG